MIESIGPPVTSFIVDRLGIQKDEGVYGLPISEEQRTQWTEALASAVRQKAHMFSEAKPAARAGRGVTVPNWAPYRIAAGFHLAQVTAMEYVLSTLAFTLLLDRVPVLSFVPMPAASKAEALNPGGVLAMLIAWRMVANGSDSDSQTVSALSPVMELQVAEMMEARPAVAVLYRAHPHPGLMEEAVPIAIRFAQIVIDQVEANAVSAA